MYRVNAERSQEKNDRNGRMQRRTKVTCATRTRRKKFACHHNSLCCVPPSGWVCRSRVSKRTLAVMPGDCTARTFAKASAIYNERRFSVTMLERARLKSVWERNHGRFE